MSNLERTKQQAEDLGYTWKLWGTFDVEQLAVWLDALTEQRTDADSYRPFGIRLEEGVLVRKHPAPKTGYLRVSNEAHGTTELTELRLNASNDLRIGADPEEIGAMREPNELMTIDPSGEVITVGQPNSRIDVEGNVAFQQPFTLARHTHSEMLEEGQMALWQRQLFVRVDGLLFSIPLKPE